MLITKLSIQGLVHEPCQLSREDLDLFQNKVEDISALIPGRWGSAVSLTEILKKVSPKEEAKYLTLSAEGGSFTACIPFRKLEQAYIIYKLADAELPTNQGGPFRFIIPDIDKCAIGGIDSCANVKFLESMSFSKEQIQDTRPISEEAHRALHEKEGYPHLHSL